VGITLVAAADTDAREAIRQADSAMYAAKRAGRGGCSFFAGSQRVRTGRRQSLAHELRNAEMRGEMHLVFQPVFDLASSEIVSVESLLRWTSPTFGEISPNEFIPIAEDTGTIVPLGAWVLRESCETLARIIEQTGRALELAVNVSAVQLARPGFAQTVRQTLAHAEFPTEKLTLEITETALMQPNADTNRTMLELERLGIRIVLDDFGTGYSSLAYLSGLPIDGLKVDQSFVQTLGGDTRSTAITTAIVRMAQALSVEVIAEGAETERQVQALRDLGCELAQGFYFHQPLSAGAVSELLRVEVAAGTLRAGKREGLD
jgi:EAL domain-containing protein (putative c-di-GMP-specific phosphodiesterase class I)